MVSNWKIKSLTFIIFYNTTQKCRLNFFPFNLKSNKITPNKFKIYHKEIFKYHKFYKSLACKTVATFGEFTYR